jgi:ElaB/YqjD/DUF883 family membrane-anchored ribosome-binding protein
MATIERTQSKANMLQEAATDVREKVEGAASSASHMLDDTTTSVGRGMESAASSLASRVDRAAEGVATAGRYLQTTKPDAMGRDVTDWVRGHPMVSLSVGFGIGLLIGRALSR